MFPVLSSAQIARIAWWAEANTSWLNGRVALDAKGFIKTGWDLTQEDLAAAR
jgi:hypothetical protein